MSAYAYGSRWLHMAANAYGCIWLHMDAYECSRAGPRATMCERGASQWTLRAPTRNSDYAGKVLSSQEKSAAGTGAPPSERQECVIGVLQSGGGSHMQPHSCHTELHIGWESAAVTGAPLPGKATMCDRGVSKWMSQSYAATCGHTAPRLSSI